ncbi:DUF2975 domain-containing protein [Parvularcula flava]|uniref:DUF2975 domain-containing protein n=1 Tax=Aquisalinus luteolus TaxID=1566827 RepID=A0A8J3ETJ6_9PROT|nr:DUF2975 domain-containing protein [Aquisalinus luteolus]NHK27023.1 DUF2975 domain-containing protein [Aquisalinus luteolus]GGH94130.1 hypothetical protein GCM10011355_07590 [Aquisalinus luteolus]
MLKKRTIFLSAVMKWVIVGLIGSIVAATIWVAFNPEIVIAELAREMASLDVPANIGMTKRAMIGLLTVPAMAVWLMILLNLHRLFANFARERVFHQQTVAAVRRAGFWLMVLVVVQFFASIASSLALTYDFGPGERTLAITFTSQHFILLSIGFVLLLMGVAMDEGLKLDDENRQIV